jgi:hypothetical protein
LRPLQGRKRWCTGFCPCTQFLRAAAFKCLARSGALLETVTLVHIQLAARASLLDVTEKSTVAEETAPDVLAHVHFVWVVDPRSDVTLLIANCYQYQASSPTAQAALLTLVSAVLARWSPQADHVVFSGD